MVSLTWDIKRPFYTKLSFQDLFVRTPGKLHQLRNNVVAEYKQAKWEKQWNERIASLFGIVNPTTVHSRMRAE